MNTTFKIPTAESVKEQFVATFNLKADLSGIAWQDMEIAIGPNADKYRPLWDRISSNEKKKPFAHFSPCWTSIPFMGISWAIARRMYPLAVMLLIALLAFNIFFPAESETPRVVALAILISFTHKNTYLRWLAHCVHRIDQQGLTGPEREAALREIGGLDQKSGWIAAGVLLVIVALPVIVLG